MRMDRNILTNLKYNTSKMLMYSVSLFCVCESIKQRQATVVRDRAFITCTKMFFYRWEYYMKNLLVLESSNYIIIDECSSTSTMSHTHKPDLKIRWMVKIHCMEPVWHSTFFCFSTRDSAWCHFARLLFLLHMKQHHSSCAPPT